MNPGIIGPICELAGTDMVIVSTEIKVAEKLLIGGGGAPEKSIPNNKLLPIYQRLQPWREAFPNLHRTIAAGLTFASSDAICERGFSALSRVQTDFRRSMRQERLSHLTLLAYEKKIVSKITFDQFMKIFRQKTRKLRV
jgi:hypothetical protein